MTPDDVYCRQRCSLSRHDPKQYHIYTTVQSFLTISVTED